MRQFCIPNSSFYIHYNLLSRQLLPYTLLFGQHFSKNILLALHIQHVAPGKLHASKAVATTIQLLLYATSEQLLLYATFFFKQRWEKKLGRWVLASRDTGPKGACRKAVAAPGTAFGRWLSRPRLRESKSDDAAPGKNSCGEATSGQWSRQRASRCHTLIAG